MDRIKNISWLILFFANTCFGVVATPIFGDEELDVNGARLIWNNNSQQFSIAASPSMSESVDYVWPAADATADGQALLSNSSGVLRFGVPTTSASHNILSATHDATVNAATRGSLIYGNTTPVWDELTIGVANTFLKSDGTDAAWSLLTVSSPVTLTGATIGWDSTLIDALTWSDGTNATNTWTFDVSGTDHTMTAGSGVMTFSHTVDASSVKADTIDGSSGNVIDPAADNSVTLGDTNLFKQISSYLLFSPLIAFNTSAISISPNGAGTPIIFSSTGSGPTIGTTAASGIDLRITPDGGDVDFVASTITTTNTIQGEQLTSTDDITMQGHLLTMGSNGSAADVVMSFLSSGNDATATYDQSDDAFDFAAGATFGDVTTNYSQFATDGDLIFVGTAGFIYGHMDVPAAAVVTVDTSATANPVEVKDDGTASANDGWEATYNNRTTFAASDLHYITVTIAGTYEVIWDMSPATAAGAGTLIHGGITIDTTTFQRDNGEGHAHVFNANDNIQVNGIGTVDCPNGNEEISLWISNDQNQKTIIEHGNMRLKLIGGT